MAEAVAVKLLTHFHMARIVADEAGAQTRL
jgi:hypothetical protein